MALNHDAVHLALRLRAKPALPAVRVIENVAPASPIAPGVEYSEEEFVPTPPRLLSATATGGRVRHDGLYVIRWFGIAGTATSQIRASADAVLALFPPGSTVIATDGTAVHIMGSPIAPSQSQINFAVPGRAVVTITIPWWAQSLNP
jgi:hypothetical protein